MEGSTVVLRVNTFKSDLKAWNQILAQATNFMDQARMVSWTVRTPEVSGRWEITEVEELAELAEMTNYWGLRFGASSWYLGRSGDTFTIAVTFLEVIRMGNTERVSFNATISKSLFPDLWEYNSTTQEWDLRTDGPVEFKNLDHLAQMLEDVDSQVYDQALGRERRPCPPA